MQGMYTNTNGHCCYTIIKQTLLIQAQSCSKHSFWTLELGNVSIAMFSCSYEGHNR